MKNDEKPKVNGSGTLFESSFFENLTRTNVIVPVTIFFIYSAGLLFWSVTQTSISVWATVALFFLGLFVFTWVEYNVHHFLFHIPTTTRMVTLHLA